MTTETFAFDVDPSIARWSRLFAVDPGAARVMLDDARFTILFGRWTLSTELDNITSVSLTGPYTWWKVAGPPHLSIADRGITFATNARAGACVAFDRPVPAIDPFGLIKHPAATVTVVDPAAFAGAVRRHVGLPLPTTG